MQKERFEGKKEICAALQNMQLHKMLSPTYTQVIRNKRTICGSKVVLLGDPQRLPKGLK